jgi:glyoxylase-like metal-dependent hydrolase (beta-lactamase superfamily II)
MEKTTQPQIIDTEMHGQIGLTGAFLVQGERNALIETGPRSSVDHVVAGLDRAGVRFLDYIVVTHIHLDHAGAAGTLAALFPGATVVVHPEGAPHLVDPTRLWRSASRIYGAEMERLWGGVDPVDRDRILTIEDGDSLDLGGRVLDALETPGHARHHHAYRERETGIVFTGDALGVRLPEIGSFRPATPPPEFDLEQAVASIARIQHSEATALWLTHFGPQDSGEQPSDVDEACALAIDALERWAEWVRLARERTHDLEQAAAIVREAAQASTDGAHSKDAIARMEQTTSYWMNTWGYMRYMDQAASARGPR